MPSKKKPEEPWQFAFFQRHKDDDAQRTTPGQAFLDACPANVRARLMNTVITIKDAPPPAFSGGGKWEAMHGEMSGIYEVRHDNKDFHYRLFCLLEHDDEKKQLGGKTLVIIDGEKKPFGTLIPEKRYKKVRELRDEYEARTPRSLLSDDDDEDDVDDDA